MASEVTFLAHAASASFLALISASVTQRANAAFPPVAHKSMPSAIQKSSVSASNKKLDIHTPAIESSDML
jgi:hypothetical protein